MTDKEKLDAIRAEVQNYIYAAHKAHTNITEGNFAHLLSFINSLQEEHVSEGLDDAAFDYAESCKYDGGEKLLCVEHFKAGAKWQKEQTMAIAIDARCFGIQGAALFSFRLPAGSYLVGSKVKVIVIKED